MSEQPLRIAVLLSGTGRTLSNLIERTAQNGLAIDIRLVIASKLGIRGLTIAENHGIPTATIQRRDYESVAAFSDALTESLPLDEVDVVVMAGFLQLYRLPEQLRGRVINIHPSLLPLFGGQGFYGHHVHRAVIESGVRVSGCTVHFVDNEYDTGPIIAQRTCDVHPSDTADTLAARVFEVECDLLPTVLAWLQRGWVRLDAGKPVFDPRTAASE